MMPLYYEAGGCMQSKNRMEYLFKDDTKRNIVIIFPGGGYERTSLREAYPVAQVLMNRGFHTAIFWYRETKLIYPEIKDEGLLMIEEVKKDHRVGRIILLGFSAGGHYALMLSIHGSHLIYKTVLAYPVVSSDPLIRHEGSIKNLLGTLDSPYLASVSLEHAIHQDVKPMFIMHTQDDATVPVENSLRLIESLQKHAIHYECHIYPKGRHGLSLATKETAFEDIDPEVFAKENKSVASWFDLAISFMKRGI